MKKKKFAVEKAVDILVNHTTPFRAFLPSTVICFIQILNNRSIPPSSPVQYTNDQLGLSLHISRRRWFLVVSAITTQQNLQPLFSLSLLPRGGVVSYLAATVREDWSRKRDSSPRRTRIPNQNNNRIKHTQQLDQSFLCFKKYLDIWWLHNHTYNRKADWRDFYIKRYLRRRTFGVLEGFTANSTSTGGQTGCGTGNFPELTDTKTGPGSSQIAKIAATAQQTLSSAWRQSSSHFDPTRATVGATTGATATGSNAMLLSDPGQLANISNMDLPSVLNQAYSPYGNPYGMYG